MNIFIMGKLIQISVFQNRKNFTLIIQKSGDIAIQSEENIIFKSDGLTLGFLIQFFRERYFALKDLNY